MGPGATVTVRGVVLNGSELGNLRFVQDREAGLALYAQPDRLEGYDALRAGDSIQATGVLKNYNGLMEMDPITSIQKLATGQRLHYLTVPIGAINTTFIEANEGRLLHVTGISGITTTGKAPVESLAGNTNYLLNGEPAALLRVARGSTGTSGLVDAPLPSGEAFDLKGVLSQFSANGVGGYQLLPRLGSDIERGGGLPRIVAEPVPVGITSQSFTLEFTTMYPGDTRVLFGPTPATMTQQRVDNSYVSQHRITLDGLEPGTTYYVQVSSRNVAGSADVPAVTFITSGKKPGRKH